MKYLLNLFDLDGTLIDSHEAICKAINQTLQYYKLPQREYSVLKKLIGVPLDMVLKGLIPENSDQARDIYRSFYFQYISDYQKTYPGIKEMLDSLKNKVLLTLITNKGRNGTDLSLSAAGLENYFDYIVTEHDVKNLKPAVEPFEKVMAHYRHEGKNLEKEDVLMIGDSPIDIEFAFNSGIDSAFASWGFYSSGDLTIKPSYIINNPVELNHINGLDEIVPVETTSELDLHTFQPKELDALLADYLNEAGKKGFTTVRIIHGKGTGVQKARVKSLLEKNPSVKEFYDAPPQIGGWGATIVELK